MLGIGQFRNSPVLAGTQICCARIGQIVPVLWTDYVGLRLFFLREIDLSTGYMVCALDVLNSLEFEIAILHCIINFVSLVNLRCDRVKNKIGFSYRVSNGMSRQSFNKP